MSVKYKLNQQLQSTSENEFLACEDCPNLTQYISFLKKVHLLTLIGSTKGKNEYHGAEEKGVVTIHDSVPLEINGTLASTNYN